MTSSPGDTKEREESQSELYDQSTSRARGVREESHSEAYDQSMNGESDHETSMTRSGRKRSEVPNEGTTDEMEALPDRIATKTKPQVMLQDGVYLV